MNNDKEIKNFSDCDQKELGFKILCYACNGSFYDLGKEDPVCPYCSTQYSKAKKQMKGSIVAAEEIVVIDDNTDDDVEDIDDADEEF